MAYAGSEDRDAKVTAAIASSIWSAYEKNGKLAFNNEDLNIVFMDCEVGVLFDHKSWLQLGTYQC